LDRPVEGVGEAAVAVADQVGEPLAGVFEVGGELAGEVGGPCCGQVGGDAEVVYAAALGLDHEGDVEALEGERTIHVEEVRGQDGAGVGAKR
jgi:hypothetical protein